MSIPHAGTLCATPKRPYTIPNEGIPIVINDRTCGYIMPDGIYYKRINGHKHIIRKWSAIGFGVDVLAVLEQSNVDRVRVVDADTGIEYLTTRQSINAQGIEWNDRFFGKQIALPCKLFAQRLPSGSLIQPKTTRPTATQISLFEVMP